MERTEARKLEVRLSEDQRLRLTDLTRNGTAPAKKIRHARILLLSDVGHRDGRRTDAYIAEVLGIHLNTVKRTRWKFVRGGEAPALDRKRREAPPVPPKVDGHVEAHLVALCCSQAPQGRTRWTLKLLASELVRRQVVTSISAECVRRALKKMSCSPGGSRAGASPSGTRPGSSRRWKTSSTSTPPSTPGRSR
jgi:transposase